MSIMNMIMVCCLCPVPTIQCPPGQTGRKGLFQKFPNYKRLWGMVYVGLSQAFCAVVLALISFCWKKGPPTNKKEEMKKREEKTKTRQVKAMSLYANWMGVGFGMSKCHVKFICRPCFPVSQTKIFFILLEWSHVCRMGWIRGSINSVSNCDYISEQVHWQLGSENLWAKASHDFCATHCPRKCPFIHQVLVPKVEAPKENREALGFMGSTNRKHLTNPKSSRF